MGRSELSRQVAVNFQTDADLDEGRSAPNHRSSSSKLFFDDIGNLVRVGLARKPWQRCDRAGKRLSRPPATEKEPDPFGSGLQFVGAGPTITFQRGTAGAWAIAGQPSVASATKYAEPHAQRQHDSPHASHASVAIKRNESTLIASEASAHRPIQDRRSADRCASLPAFRKGARLRPEPARHARRRGRFRYCAGVECPDRGQCWRSASARTQPGC